MAGKLCFLVCQNLERELRTVIESEKFEDVALVVFPADCARPQPAEVMTNILLECKHKYDRVYLLGGCCTSGAREDYEGLARYLSPQPEQCFYLFQSKNFIDSYTGKGGYLLTPGWLERWQRYVDTWGFDRKTAGEFFRESASRLVLLDTGTGTSTAENISEFAEYVRLPFEAVSVGLDYFRLMIRQEIVK